MAAQEVLPGIAAPPGRELAISVDTLVSGVHFPRDTAPADIGYKVLAVNLSDMAAMGAAPDWAVMSLTLPRRDEDWLSAFDRGFDALAEQYRVRLLARDIGIGPLAITLQIHGWVPAGLALRRDGARPGDLVFVTGSLGDAGLGLSLLPEPGKWGAEVSGAHRAFVLDRLNRPTPRVAEGIALRGIATAAIDVSDGLAADLGHIVTASRRRMGENADLHARIDVEKLPLSPALHRLSGQDAARRFALSSGDDYELCFTAPQRRYESLLRIASGFSCPITCLGRMERGPGESLVRFSGSGSDSDLELTNMPSLTDQGYRHFK
uniref:Thiamine-monophosphate kinase n=1 Tax=Candidatus Kentrum sp. DK TaxID=2126562 RepID=A0A450TAD5_9GAMM|nr:MAG: thiamine-phosphate kinase [Candidatus Kentron sp. DK]